MKKPAEDWIISAGFIMLLQTIANFSWRTFFLYRTWSW